MQAHAIESKAVSTAHMGWVVAEDVRSADGKRLLRKGATIDDSALGQWDDVAPGSIHLIELGADDLHEDIAGRRIAEAVSGDGIQIKGPVQSRYNLVSTRKGFLRVDPELIRGVNQVEGATVFTLLDRQTVLPGKVVAGVKVTPIALPEKHVRRVEQICAAHDLPAITVLPFAPKRVSVVATEGLSEKLRERFRERVEQKIRWYGSDVEEIRFVEASPAAVAATFEDFLADGVDIMMAAGGNTIDPLDPVFLALNTIGATMIHFGAPAHPGSMFWLAEVDGVPIFNLASCSMYSQATVADLILPLVMTGRTVTTDDIVDLGYGGLLEREMSFRFPDYDAEVSDEESLE